jgi:hypothetical protein
MSDQIENIEIRTQQALTAYNQSDKPNLAKLAREFEIPRGRLRSTKLIKDLENQNQQVKRHIQRSMDANL